MLALPPQGQTRVRLERALEVLSSVAVECTPSMPFERPFCHHLHEVILLLPAARAIVLLFVCARHAPSYSAAQDQLSSSRSTSS